MFNTGDSLRKYLLFCTFHCFKQFFSHAHRFACTGSTCNNSSKCGCHFSTLDINAHFRTLFFTKFELLELHLKVHLFERMCEFVWALVQGCWLEVISTFLYIWALVCVGMVGLPVRAHVEFLRLLMQVFDCLRVSIFQSQALSIFSKRDVHKALLYSVETYFQNLLT